MPAYVSNIPIGPIAYASIGTNTTDVNGQFWITEIFIPTNMVITKIGFLQGGTATTNNTLVAIWDGGGNLLTTSNTAGVVLSGANTFQEQTLLATVQLYGPSSYFIAIQGNGTQAGSFQILPASTYNNLRCNTLAGTFGTVPATISVPTAFNAGTAPVVYVK